MSESTSTLEALASKIQAAAWDLATQLWTMMHGMVTVALAGLFTLEAVEGNLSAMAVNLYVGFGDERGPARRSVERARRRMEAHATGV